MSDKIYPKGRLALGNGDLLDVTNVRHRVSNNGKLVHTIARSPSGVFKGNIDTELSFDAVVSEDGFERDYLKAVMNGEIKQLRIKVPGETITVKGMPTERSVEFGMDDAIKYSVNFIGKTTAS